MKTFLLTFFVFLAAAAGALEKPNVKLSDDFVDISSYKFVATDIRYASPNNFVGENLYGDWNKPYLHKVAAEKLKAAAENLQKLHPGWKLLVFDALRPRSIQRKLWDRVAGTDKQKYVANPEKGSVHNYGFAVDLSLQNEKGQEVDMGTPFDSFEDLAQPRMEARFLKEGKLTSQQVENRQILRKVMTDAGFTQLPIEWWHYDALPSKKLKTQYRIVE